MCSSAQISVCFVVFIWAKRRRNEVKHYFRSKWERENQCWWMRGKAPSNSRTECLTVWGSFQLKDFLFGSHRGNLGSSMWCVRLAQLTLRVLAFFLSVCTATKQNIGQNLQGNLGHCKSETDPSSADKTLLEEKMKVEKKLRETIKKYNPALADTENLHQVGGGGQAVYDIQNFCSYSLVVVDVTEKATQSVAKEKSSSNLYLKSIVGLVLLMSRFRQCSPNIAAQAPPHQVHIWPLWTQGLLPCLCGGKITGHCSTS